MLPQVTTTLLSSAARLHGRIAAGLLLAAGGGSAAAQSNVALPEVTISAHQVPVETANAGASVTVLQGSQLRANGVPTVAEALRSVPGVEVTQSGAPGSYTQVRIRGSDANHVLVMIDDVPMNRLDAGDFDFANFGVEAIERIEVLRGPQSGIYGSAAQAGVISITTKSGRGLAKPETVIWGEAGSRKTGSVAYSTRGAAGPFYGAVTVQNMNTAGYNIARTGDEKDGFRTRTVTAKGGIDITPQLNVEGMFRQVERKVQYDQEQFPPNDPPLFDSFAFDTFKTTSGRAAATLKLFDDRWVQKASWSTLRDNYINDYGFGPLALFTTLGKRDRMDYRSSFTFDTAGVRHTASAILDREQEWFSNNVGADKSRSRDGLAGEYLVETPFGLSVSGAVRKDWNEVFADADTWRLTANQRIAQTATRLHASAGTGVTNPSFTEQYGMFFNFVGNPALTPEKSFGWDAGVEQSFLNGRVVVDVTYFQSDVTDQIVAGSIGGIATAVNAPGTSLRKGVETSGKFNVYDWLQLTATYTYTDATRPDDTPEPRRPPHSASLSATVLFLSGRGRFTGSYFYNSKREDRALISFGPPTRVLLPAYNTFAAMLSYDINKWATAYVRAENLFDARYEEVYSYRAPPVAAYAGLRIKLGD